MKAEGQSSFRQDWRTQSAVLHELQTLAESTQRLSEELRARHQDIPWVRISGLRNKLAHDYLAVSLETVWRILLDDLTRLEVVVSEELERQ